MLNLLAGFPLWKAFTVSVFFIFLLVGLSIYKDYGLSWDELYQRKLGVLTKEYVLGRNQDLLELGDRYYGQVFNLLQVSVEQLTKTQDFPDFIFIDHLVNFVFFYGGVVVFFLLAHRLFKDWKLGLAAAAAFVLSPVIFSHSFYNSKDIPFLTAFIFSMYTLVRLDDRPGLLRTIAHGVFSGFVISLRVLGAVVPILTFLVILVRQLAAAKPDRLAWQKTFRLAFVYVVVTAVFAVLLFPVSWRDPIGSYWQAFQQFRLFADWNDRMLFMGEFVTAASIPWYYLPVWIGISTPISYLVLFVSGLPFSVRWLIKRPLGELSLSKRRLLLVLVVLSSSDDYYCGKIGCI